MKNLLRVIIRFISTFLVAGICISAVWMSGALLDRNESSFIQAALGLFVAAIPAAAVVAVFLLFFIMNRLFSSRLLGYPVIFILALLALGGPALIVRYIDFTQILRVEALPLAYRPVAAWFNETARGPWLEFAAGLASFAAFSSGFWGITRLSRSRPIIGAFLAPNGALAVLYLFSIYLSGPADAAFSLAGLSLPRALSTSVLAAASALALVIADALIARKPEGGRLHG